MFEKRLCVTEPVKFYHHLARDRCFRLCDTHVYIYIEVLSICQLTENMSKETTLIQLNFDSQSPESVKFHS